jgi:hypothetical protein
MRSVLILLLFGLAACAPHKPDPMDQVNTESLHYMRLRYADEAKRMPQVQRDGQTLIITADNGKTIRFTDNNPCVGFECSLYLFQDMYADGQFYRVNHHHSEFFIPDYLISRRTGAITDMLGPLEERNRSPNKQWIVNAVGGDAGPEAGIYLWRISDGELLPIVAHPFAEYGSFTFTGWNAESTAAAFKKGGYYKQCPDASGIPSWGTSDLVLQKRNGAWVIEETHIQCR